MAAEEEEGNNKHEMLKGIRVRLAFQKLGQFDLMARPEMSILVGHNKIKEHTQDSTSWAPFLWPIGPRPPYEEARSNIKDLHTRYTQVWKFWYAQTQMQSLRLVPLPRRVANLVDIFVYFCDTLVIMFKTVGPGEIPLHLEDKVNV